RGGTADWDECAHLAAPARGGGHVVSRRRGRDLRGSGGRAARCGATGGAGGAPVGLLGCVEFYGRLQKMDGPHAGSCRQKPPLTTENILDRTETKEIQNPAPIR